MNRRPNFLIIGAMKCGTTSLHDRLAAQDGIFMPSVKEPNFFSDDDQFARGLEWYESLFAAADDGDIIGEASTHYTKRPVHPDAPERIAEHLPDARLIYVMRHPIDRLVSQYVHEWSQRVVDLDINRAIDAFTPLIDYSRYAWQLEPYLQRFGRDRILPVSFERFKREPHEVLREIAAFIGYGDELRFDEEAKASNVSNQRMRKSGLRDAVLEAPGLKQLRRNLVPQGLRDRVKRWWMMKERPRLSEANIRRLETRFDVDLATLGEWLGLKGLNCQTFSQQMAGGALIWQSPPGPVSVEAPTEEASRSA